MQHHIFLSLGTNLGDRQQIMQVARETISRNIGRWSKISSVYESEPWGFTAESNFYNQVIELYSLLTPQDLLMEILSVEEKMGRQRTPGIYGSRIIDIDILFYDDKVINKENLIIPHPFIPLRRFVLVPLTEIAPEFIHPVLPCSMSELLEKCPDKRKVWKIS